MAIAAEIYSVNGELGPQENSVRGDLGPLVNSVQVKSVRSSTVGFHTPRPANFAAITAKIPVKFSCPYS